MKAPLANAERREARLLARRVVANVFTEHFGRGPQRAEPIYSLDPMARLALVSAIEQQLGITFTDDDIEFVETESDLVHRGTMALLRRDS